MNDFDPQAPFIAQDGLEYGCVADFILGQPQSCWRNEHIQEARRRKTPEEFVRRWIKAFDGEDPRPSGQLDWSEISERRINANFEVDQHGYGLI